VTRAATALRPTERRELQACAAHAGLESAAVSRESGLASSALRLTYLLYLTYPSALAIFVILVKIVELKFIEYFDENPTDQ
jgi:hypothetical protein